MNPLLLIYLGDVVHGLTVLLCIAGSILGAVTIVATLEEYKVKYIVIFGSLSVAAWLTAVILPSRNTLYLYAAVETGKEIANNPRMQKLFDKVELVLNKKLDEAINETK